MAEHGIEKTTFITHTDLFEFIVMPYGLVNGQATLQHQVDDLLAGLLWIICLCFVDDLNVFFKTFTDDWRHLRLVFDRFRPGNLKFNPDKCNLFKESTQYLGYIVMKGGRVQPDPKKIEAVQQIPVPTCVRDIHSFLGLASYYRQFRLHSLTMSRGGEVVLWRIRTKKHDPPIYPLEKFISLLQILKYFQIPPCPP